MSSSRSAASRRYRPASGEAGPFSLLSYADVRKRAEQIARVTSIRFMPPWPPEPGYGDLAGARRLGDDQIALIQRWARAGAPEGPRMEVGLRPPDDDLEVGQPLQPIRDRGHARSELAGAPTRVTLSREPRPALRRGGDHRSRGNRAGRTERGLGPTDLE